MKKILKTSIIPLLASLVFASCEKKDIPQDVATLGTGAYLKLVTQGNNIIDYANLAGSTVTQTVTDYGDAVATVVVYVTKGGTTLNKTNWKKVKEIPYSDDTKIDVTATEIATALGIPPSGLETGATYTLYNQAVTADGKIFDITNINSGFAGNPNYKIAFTWAAVVVCPFVATGFPGNFRVDVDEWADWATGTPLPAVTAATATSITLVVYPNPAVGGFGQQPVTVTINPATGAATVASQVYGSYTGFDNNIKVRTSGSNNWVFSCVGRITLRLNHTGAANWGDYTLTLTKL